MFIVSLTYTRPLQEIDRLLPEHLEFLHAGYREGVFLASGRRQPRTGGVILARARSREALLARLEDDPFRKAGAAEYEIVEVDVSLTAAGLEALADQTH